MYLQCVYLHFCIFLCLLRKHRNDQICLGLTLLLFYCLKTMQKFLFFLFLLNSAFMSKLEKWTENTILTEVFCLETFCGPKCKTALETD